jgi:GNAT superfamily N-acetyltransferase
MKTIRLADSNDLAVIQELARKIWPLSYGDILEESQLAYMLDKMYSTDSLRQQLLQADHRFILISDDNRPVGFASYSCPKDHSRIGRLHKIYVLHEQQGSGTGKMLLAHIIEDCKKKGAFSLELNVNRHNKARYFYEKQGFTVKRTEDIDIGSGYFMNDYLMELPLR